MLNNFGVVLAALGRIAEAVSLFGDAVRAFPDYRDASANLLAEQPTLRLTESQAQRLWNLDTDTCSVLMSELIAVRFLERRGVQYQLPALTDLP